MNLLLMYKNRKKILGMNERNLKYIRKNNLNKALEIADNKIYTKRVLEENKIPTPALIDHIENYNEARSFDWDSLPNSFVMKPVHGLEGSGIEIFYNRDKNGNWIRGDGSKVSIEDLKLLALDIIEGKYSLYNQKDSILFEERVKMHKAFKYFAYKGAPDVRIIVYNNIPLMSYVRLPTKESRGKGNLAQGAIGAAIDLVSGTTTSAIIGKSEQIERVPGTNLSLRGLKIPYWNQLLRTAIEAQKATNLGFAAIDFLIDREKGPVIIEMNARPGLSIQIANQDGLRWRLKKAAGIKVTSTNKGIRVAKDMFGGQAEEDIEKVSGKQLVSHIEPVEILTKDNTKISSLALIDTSRRTTTIEQKLARSAGIIDEETIIDEPMISDIKFSLAGVTIETDCRVVPYPIKGYKILVGRKSLGDFLIDIRKVASGQEEKQKTQLLTQEPYTDPIIIDNQLEEISRQIFITGNIRPINLIKEKKQFFKNTDYNPNYLYKPVEIDTDKILDRLNTLKPDDTTIIGELFSEKIRKLKQALYLIEAIGDDDIFPDRSEQLYGIPNEEIFQKALELINNIPSPVDNSQRLKYISFNEVKNTLESALEKINYKGSIDYVKNGPTKASVHRSGNKILINKNYKFTKEKLEGTIAHEIEVHLRRAIAGKNKKYKIFSYGTANYIETEEGLAVFNKSQRLNSQQPVRNAAIMYVSAYLNHKGSFNETYKYLRALGLTERNAYKYTVRTKKGINNTTNKGAFLKDMLYFTGYLKVAKLTDNEREALLDNGKTHELITL